MLHHLISQKCSLLAQLKIMGLIKEPFTKSYWFMSSRLSRQIILEGHLSFESIKTSVSTTHIQETASVKCSLNILWTLESSRCSAAPDA